MYYQGKYFNKYLRRSVSILLVLVLLLSAGYGAYASGAEHGQVNFKDMEYKRPNINEFNSLVREVESNLGSAANASKVLSDFEKMVSFIEELESQSTLAYIRFCLDVTNDYYADQYSLITNDYLTVSSELSRVSSLILDSPCKDAAEEIWSEYRILLSQSTPLTKELEALYEKQSQLTQKYDQTILTTFDSYEEYNQVLGQIYADLISVRIELSKLYGVDYSDLMFNTYGRDFTAQQAAQFCKDVKKYILPVYDSFYDLLDEETIYQLESRTSQLSTEDTLAFIKEKLPGISPDLSEAFDYMIKYELYDLEYVENKLDMGFTTLIGSYNAPFMYNLPYGNFSDISTIVHEYGHYNATYHHADDLKGWEGAYNLDLAEIHSQGLELLFTPYYTDLFGEKLGKAATDTIVDNHLYTLIQSCLVHEFELKAHEHPNPTVSELNQIYLDLCIDYGFLTEGTDISSVMLPWTNISHIYKQPFYYISYAASVAPSLELWLISLDHRQDAIDTYLELISYGEMYTYLSVLRTCGLGNPFSGDYIKSFAASFNEYIYGRGPGSTFTDISGHWALTQILWSVEEGYFSGITQKTFQPDRNITRGMFVTVLARLYEAETGKTAGAGSSAKEIFPDVDYNSWYGPAVGWASENGITAGTDGGRFEPEQSITREEMAVMLFNYLNLMDVTYDYTVNKLDFSDGSSISEWAAASVSEMQQYGILSGKANGRFDPEGSAIRAEMAVILYILDRLEPITADQTPEYDPETEDDTAPEDFEDAA